MIKAQCYQIAIRKHSDSFLMDNELDLFDFVLVKNSLFSEYADPFLFEHNSTHYLFAEKINKITHKGSIVVSVINGVKKIHRFKTVVKAKYHMSFPFVFVLGGEICIIPETNEDNSISLYKFKKFPLEAFKHKEIIKNVKNVDSILFGKYLFSYSIETKNFRSQIYSFDGKKVCESIDEDNTKRGAGNVFKHGDDYILPTQIGKPNYGFGLVFNKILFDQKKGFPKLMKICSINANDACRILKRKIDGLHTYNRDSEYEVIDYSIARFSLVGLIGKIYRRLRRNKK